MRALLVVLATAVLVVAALVVFRPAPADADTCLGPSNRGCTLWGDAGACLVFDGGCKGTEVNPLASAEQKQKTYTAPDLNLVLNDAPDASCGSVDPKKCYDLSALGGDLCLLRQSTGAQFFTPEWPTCAASTGTNGYFVAQGSHIEHCPTGASPTPDAGAPGDAAVYCGKCLSGSCAAAFNAREAK